ncbi:DUF4153 domain-containing protein [Bacillus tuaregi]|uniref:DUF4153 domain-containing protein n=1 Tax=Bacillus tuaregi TaxID=1816695 RepID=UPI0008F90651|nr:DUF4173 domain-containing protein [Bacillus tuaregi]
MEIKMKQQDWIFFLLCLLLGIVAEEALFRGQIGVSYFVFIVVFYSIFFWRFRSFSFSHQRIGYFLLIIIWILAAGYYLYDTALFYGLNILVIPGLVILHLVLITSPKTMKWNQLFFSPYIILRLMDGIRYNYHFTKSAAVKSKGNKGEERFLVWKKILIGILISVPILFIILNLLIEADSQFDRLVGRLPELLSLRVDYIFRVVIILIYAFGFFGFLQALSQKRTPVKELAVRPVIMDGVITITVLVLLDLVYILFVAVQFKYFFSGSLEAGFTYAEYARRGFFELLFVTLINLTVIIGVICLSKDVHGYLKQSIRTALSILVLSSGVILVSAFMRMALYEEVYGFTFTRILVHSFMLFLLVIFAYTLVKIWLEKLSLFHFYFIASLLYYAGINVVNIDQMVVDRNLSRYEETGKIDIQYLHYLSSTGRLGLIELYEKHPQTPGLKELLTQQKAEREYSNSNSWQSYNVTRQRVYEELSKLDL